MLCLPGKDGRLRFQSLLEALGRRGVKSVLIEGGGQAVAAAFSEGVVDKVVFFYAPLLLGSEGRAMIGPLGVDRIAAGCKLHTMEVQRVGRDILVSAYVGEKRRKHAHLDSSS